VKNKRLFPPDRSRRRTSLLLTPPRRASAPPTPASATRWPRSKRRSGYSARRRDESARPRRIDPVRRAH